MHDINLAVDRAILPLFFFFFISPVCDVFHNEMFRLMLLLSDCMCENTASRK